MLNASARSPTRRRAIGAALLGTALGGFFDGILLHQILQWHHLFSGLVPSDSIIDLRFQVMADGLFHLAHYLAAVAGLAFLWSSRRSMQDQGANRHLSGWALIGFGGWHVFDAVVSHWMLQIHRIRMDVDNPLAWDLVWLVPFGIVPLAVGIWLLRGWQDSGQPPRGRKTAVVLGMTAVIAGPIAALPPAGSDADMTIAVFRPDLSFSQIVAALDAVDGRIVWTDDAMGVWVIALGPDARATTLYRHGAMLVSGGTVAVGCLDWTQV
jgi:uncharacterized membrane protein